MDDQDRTNGFHQALLLSSSVLPNAEVLVVPLSASGGTLFERSEVMAVYSKLTDQVRLTPTQFSSRQGSTIDTFLIHHQATTNDDQTIQEMVTASKEVSANYTISDTGRLTLVVPEEYRAWTSGASGDGGKGAAWDRRSVTVEIADHTLAPDYIISDAALHKAAALLNDLRTRYTIKNVYGHRDLYEKFGASYPTFCPGPTTVNKILALANSGASATPPKTTTNAPTAPSNMNASVPSTSGSGWAFNLPATAQIVRLQSALGRRGRYSGPANGKFNLDTAKGVQRTIQNVGYTGAIDGAIENIGCGLIQTYAQKYGSYAGPIDHKLGVNSWSGFILGLERP